MQAMVLHAPGQPLRLERVPLPSLGPDQVLIEVEACGVCRTDLHIRDGELAFPDHPVILGHEIIGRIVAHPSGGAGQTGVSGLAGGADDLSMGTRVGVPWLGWTCGHCRFCSTERENLCGEASFTGYSLPGGYAEFTVADLRYCFPIPEELDPAATAPFLCAGLIGYRALRMAGSARRVGLYGFGAAAHLIAQLAVHEHRDVYAFTRPGDDPGQALARKLGARWAGASTERPPEPLDAAVIFAPVGDLVPAALGAVDKGGVVVCAGIHMSPIPAFAYDLLWGERQIRSVANLTRRDGIEFFAAAARAGLRADVETFELAEAETALDRLRSGKITGAAVLRIASGRGGPAITRRVDRGSPDEV